MPRAGNQTRERIIVAAARLFYAEGIRAVSIDAVAEKAGVTKKTFYYYFRSKDELIAEYLAAQDQPTLKLYARWFDDTAGSAEDKIRGLFIKFAQSANTSKWKGCGFHRTAAELANTPGHPALKAGSAHKKRFEAWLVAALRNQSVKDADAIARKVVILFDGAAAIMLIHRDPAYIEEAGNAAASLIKQSVI
jgi:AcrR family transcriptional regulator